MHPANMASSKASSASIAILLLLLLPLAIRPALALQVTSGSPCASSCASAPQLSRGSSYGLACRDQDFLTKYAGQLHQSCLVCLQDSTYSKDGQTDQQWFLYHLRSLFGSCVFDHPTEQGPALDSCIEDGPCQGLDVVLGPGRSGGYCHVNGSASLSQSVETCLACVRSSGSHGRLANFLVAIEAGCANKPAPGELVGLSDSVFSQSLIKATRQSSNDTSSGSSLNPGVIAGIAVGVVAFVAIVSGCLVYCLCSARRRRRSPPSSSSSSSSSRSSLLSFRCQTRVTPRTPRFPFPRDVEATREDTSMAQQHRHSRVYLDRGAALNSNPASVHWQAPTSWCTTRSHTPPGSSTAALVSPPPSAHFAPAASRAFHQRSACPSISSSISSISSLAASPSTPLIHPRTDGGQACSPSSAMDPSASLVPGLAISTHGETALYAKQDAVQGQGKTGFSYQPWGGRRERRKDSQASPPPVDHSIEEEKYSPLILPSEFSPFQVAYPPPPAWQP